MKLKIVIGLLMSFGIFFHTSAIDGATNQETSDSELLNLPGDNLDLYAVMDLFQESKTIEEFENALNDEATGINNLDLNLDDEVDFIKVTTKQEKDDFVFVLQVDIAKEETQDVGVILVTKDEEEKVNIQIVGDESLYGKDYVIEPKTVTPSVTANPAYSGPDTTVVVNQESTVVVVESTPIVHYVYSPMYNPYYSPYYYGYYPPYYHPYPVISVNIYFSRHRYHRNHYHGGRYGRGGNTVIIRNNNNYNNYNKTRNTSKTVNNNKANGNYKNKSASNNKGNTQNKAASSTKNKGTGSNQSKQETNKTNKSNSNASGQNSNVNKTNNTKKATPSSGSSAKPSTQPSTQPSSKPSSKPASRPAATPKGRKK